jgi:hypothetical protein
MAGRLRDILSNDDATVEELAQNAAKMRGAGPDDPIPFDAYGSAPKEPPQDQERIAAIRELVKQILSPHTNPEATAEGVMEGRKRRLDSMGGRNPGGAFDIIYKKTKEKDDALDELRRQGL